MKATLLYSFLQKTINYAVGFLLKALGSFSNNEGDGYENFTLKVNSRCFKLYRAYSISFNSSNVGNVFWSLILKDCIEFHEKKKEVAVLGSHPLKN